MTRVLINREECTVQVKGDFIMLLYTAVATDPVPIGVREVSQLLRSRKDETAAKLVAGEKSYVMKFDSLRDRESLIEAIVRIQEAAQAPSNEDWVTSTICHAAVDVGVVDETTLQSIIAAAGQRGVEQAFDALETLVDRETFQLRPITEQMENDVLRQIPVLAAIFRERVVDAETKRSFWEAVVRKYFCFARTFLEEDIQRLEGTTVPAAATVSATPASAAATAAASLSPAAAASLSVINASSLSALPKGSATATVDTDVNEEELLHLEEDATPLQHSFYHAFAAARHRRVCVVAPPTLSVGGSGDGLLFPQTVTSPHAAAVSASRFVGRDVLRQFPSGPIEKSALETLRLFWRSGVKQRRGVLAKYTNNAKKGNVSFIQRVCLEQASRTANYSPDS